MRVAELWAKKVVAGDRAYAEIPAQLKDEVDTLLNKAGYTPPTTRKATLKKS